MLPFCLDDTVVNHPAPSLQPLRNYFQVIQSLVNLECLLPWLFQDSILKDEEINWLRNQQSRGCKVMDLIRAIENKGKAGIKGLVHCLENETEHLGHIELAAELKKGDLKG